MLVAVLFLYGAIAMEWRRAKFFVLATGMLLFVMAIPLWLTNAGGATDTYEMMSLLILLFICVMLGIASYGAGAALNKLINRITRASNGRT